GVATAVHVDRQPIEFGVLGALVESRTNIEEFILQTQRRLIVGKDIGNLAGALIRRAASREHCDCKNHRWKAPRVHYSSSSSSSSSLSSLSSRSESWRSLSWSRPSIRFMFNSISTLAILTMPPTTLPIPPVVVPVVPVLWPPFNRPSRIPPPVPEASPPPMAPEKSETRPCMKM